jgi:hypothetical protein
LIYQGFLQTKPALFPLAALSPPVSIPPSRFHFLLAVYSPDGK